MESEDPPSETPAEKEFNRAIEELAKVKSDCTARLEELQQNVSRLASGFSGGNSGEGGGGSAVGFANKIVETLNPPHHNISTNSSRSWVDVLRRNMTSLAGHNQTVVQGDTGCPTCPDPTLVRECPPCEECRPCDLDPGTAGGSSSDGCVPHPPLVSDSEMVEVPVAFLVGVATTLLVLVLAVVLGAIIRYLPLIVSGFLVLILLCMVWYYSSRYPESARRIGARVWAALRSGVSAAVERLLGRQNSEVSRKAVKVDSLCRGVIF
jgi:hypothetical protein